MTVRSVVQFLAGHVKALTAHVAGKKTYLVGGALVVYSLGVSRAWWPSDPTIWGALGGTGLITLRAAVTRLLTQFLDDLTVASATPADLKPQTSNIKP